MKIKFFIAVVSFIFLNCQGDHKESLISNETELKTNEGKFCIVQGKLLISDSIKRTPTRLVLNDSSIVYLGSFSEYSTFDFSNINSFSNKEVLIKGIPYFDSIPDKYKIISRLNGPYLVDIEEINEVKNNLRSEKSE